ncbi:MAG: DNA mismatch repair endonuclease MutL [Bacteroidales bacterium]|nr:DNA mismatch repair endonuclease MutL [Bacteroidales bacterium]
MDIISVLPDNVANQISAGEVIQRPASAVKELLENAVDSGADRIDVVIKDAGRTLIQITDNGCGMSQGDALRCIQRHATSKIHSAEDLFAIRTFGFRGEALASIASVAQVELRTRRHGEELGTTLIIEGSEVIESSKGAMPEGTTVAVKNLFFNVPARRKFLKSNTAEFRHILEEFYRVCLVQPDIAFSLHHNGQAIHKLPPNKLLHRIIGVFGEQYRERMLPVNLSTEQFSVAGFVGKPEFARRTKGEQYFFANQRFIRHPYLHHAVMGAYHDLIPENAFPAYFLFMEVHPSTIDVNIHPTKTEIKFQDERMVYGMLKSAVRETLGKSGAMPSLDFDVERSFELPSGMDERPLKQPTVRINPDFNPFHAQVPGLSERDRHNRERWTQLFSPADNRSEHFSDNNIQNPVDTLPSAGKLSETSGFDRLFQIQGTYIITPVKSGLLVVHQQRAHERILFERFLAALKTSRSLSQQQLFPVNLHLPPADAMLLREVMEDLRTFGLDIREMSGDTFVVDGIPTDSRENDVQSLVDAFLEGYKSGTGHSQERQPTAAKALAKSMAVKVGLPLRNEEMHALIDDLFACAIPDTAPDGKPCLLIIKTEELSERLKF